jgi:defect-in-organelle-trafficking protein DotC
MSPTSEAVTGVNSIRAQLLMEGGRTVGFQGGLSARAHELVAGLHRRQRALDIQYEFGSLISRSGVLPPVIVESRDVAAFTPDQIRTANRVYKIEREERFVSVPPTWRDYLLIGLPLSAAVELPIMEARPVDNAEMTVWQEAVSQGWREGAEQAEAILEANFNRLTRDYTGMLLYSTLVQQGMVGTSTVTDSVQTVTGDRGEITLGDRVKRLTARAGFEPDASKWRPTIKVGPLPPPPTPAKVQAPAAPLQPAKVMAVPPAQPLIAATVAQVKANAAVAAPKAIVNVSSNALPVKPQKPNSVASVPPPVQKAVSIPVEAKVPAAVSVKPTPIPPVKVAPKPLPVKPKQVWTAAAGSTLRETVEAWAKKAGWHVDWKPEDLNYGISGSIRIEGSFEEAVGQLFAYYEHAERPMEVPASRSQKLLRVIEKNTESTKFQSRKSS